MSVSNPGLSKQYRTIRSQLKQSIQMDQSDSSKYQKYRQFRKSVWGILYTIVFKIINIRFIGRNLEEFYVMDL